MSEANKVMVSRFVEAINAGGEDAAVEGRFRCSGTHLGEFLGEAPTGKRMEVEEVFFLRAEDSLGRMRQLGLLSSGTRTS